MKCQYCNVDLPYKHYQCHLCGNIMCYKHIADISKQKLIDLDGVTFGSLICKICQFQLEEKE